MPTCTLQKSQTWDHAGRVQDLLAPFKSSAEVQWHQPRAPGARTETTIVVKVTHLKLQPAFAHVPIVHAAIRVLQASLHSQKQARAPLPPTLFGAVACLHLMV